MTNVTMALSHAILLSQKSACDLLRDVKHIPGEPAMLWDELPLSGNTESDRPAGYLVFWDCTEFAQRASGVFPLEH